MNNSLNFNLNEMLFDECNNLVDVQGYLNKCDCQHSRVDLRDICRFHRRVRRDTDGRSPCSSTECWLQQKSTVNFITDSLNHCISSYQLILIRDRQSTARGPQQACRGPCVCSAVRAGPGRAGPAGQTLPSPGFNRYNISI